jgi:hypothetical protein
MSALAAHFGDLMETRDAGPLLTPAHQPSMFSRVPEGPARPPNPLVIV